MRSPPWTLDETSLRRLLEWLSRDPERAPQLYNALRQRLARVFAWRGLPDADHLVDEVFDRAARKLAEGAVETSVDPYAYLYGVAMFVLREYWSRQAKPVRPAPAAESGEDERLAALDACLDALDPEERDLVLAYYASGRSEKIPARKALAVRLGVSENALRIRMHRLRAKIETCVRRRMESGEEA